MMVPGVPPAYLPPLRFPCHFTPEEDVRTLLGLCQLVEGTVVEVGCNVGSLTRELACALAPRWVIGVDCMDAPMCSEQVCERPTAGVGWLARPYANVALLHKMSQMLTIEDLTMHGPVALIFIDGDHTEQGVTGDTEVAMAYKAHAAKQGWPVPVVAWHDARPDKPEWCAVWRVLEKRAETIYHYGGVAWMLPM